MMPKEKAKEIFNKLNDKIISFDDKTMCINSS